MADHVRIGVLGAARIVPAALVRPGRSVASVEVAAIAAREVGRAQEFADRFGIPQVHGSYDELLDDPNVDAVYVPLPNGLHGKWTLAALAAGKHVLCEKPFAANADEAAEVAAAAKSSGLVVMEAFHYRYHPLALRLAEVVAELGELRHVEARLAFPMPKFKDIRYSLDLAGGALMDAGCYAVNMVRYLGGDEPEVKSARALLKGEGVDRAMRAELKFPAGHTGTVVTSMWSRSLLRLSAKVLGANGELRVFNPFSPQHGHRLTVKLDGHRRVERFDRRPSYEYQLEAFADAVLHGKPFPTTADDAVATMRVVDDIYRAAGLPVRQPS
ncbi:Gfo/Idh/MocA family oxidoreductase [Saccharothrix sp. 6-C]|uniref:Gfo/Idh/MocA family protein n=1 Tax=Saccharothrix sp. 6-C TaxID=2781735 RepID=UPI0019176125|nr:Gfo/Idh/MocA family oxidoreductase [Saccharothrix sp. 6-C]QQQ75776.1 Gfo/Idh/MocA family oxidoreductase [Saccharothrix sp. 6-C]